MIIKCNGTKNLIRPGLLFIDVILPGDSRGSANALKLEPINKTSSAIPREQLEFSGFGKGGNVLSNLNLHDVYPEPGMYVVKPKANPTDNEDLVNEVKKPFYVYVDAQSEGSKYLADTFKIYIQSTALHEDVISNCAKFDWASLPGSRKVNLGKPSSGYTGEVFCLLNSFVLDAGNYALNINVGMMPQVMNPSISPSPKQEDMIGHLVNITAGVKSFFKYRNTPLRVGNVSCSSQLSLVDDVIRFAKTSGDGVYSRNEVLQSLLVYEKMNQYLDRIIYPNNSVSEKVNVFQFLNSVDDKILSGTISISDGSLRGLVKTSEGDYVLEDSVDTDESYSISSLGIFRHIDKLITLHIALTGYYAQLGRMDDHSLLDQAALYTKENFFPMSPQLARAYGISFASTNFLDHVNKPDL